MRQRAEKLRARRWLVIGGVGVLLTTSAAVTFALTAGSSTPTLSSALQARDLGSREIGLFSQPATSQDMAAAAAAAGSPFLTKLGADTADARLAASGSWGKVIIMPMNSGDEPAICATVASANGGNGVHNCPSLTAVAAGEIVLPIWDSIGATIGFVGVVPDGIASVKDVDTGQTLPIKNNVYVLLGQTQPPGTLVFTKTDGSTVQRTRLAAGAAPVAP